MDGLVRVTRGVWRPAAEVDHLHDRVAAALTGCPAGTVVSGVTAARLHGLWLPPPVIAERIEVVVHNEIPAGAHRSGSRRPEIRARRQRLRPDEITVLGALAITTEARTWLDLADRLVVPDLIAAGDSALRGDAALDELTELTRRSRGGRGVARARAAVQMLDRRSRSRPESHLRYSLVSRGLPTPRVNEPIFSATGEWLAEPDLSYDDVKLAIEYNGADHADVRRMRRDITRDVDIRLRGGWRSVTFGPKEVFGRPHEVAALVTHLRRTDRPPR